jgi:hypothetical protein
VPNGTRQLPDQVCIDGGGTGPAVDIGITVRRGQRDSAPPQKGQHDDAAVEALVTVAAKATGA